jgi:hypothetical protein
MPRGYPDYVTPNTTFSNVQFDGSAIVAGLGGMVSIDGRGTSMFVDMFARGGGAWQQFKNSKGAYPRLTYSHPYVFTPPVSMLLDPVENGGESAVLRSFGVLPHSNIGVEMVIFVPADGCHPRIGVSHWGRNEYQYYYEVLLNRADETVEVITDDGYQVAYDFSDRYELPYGWIYIKLVISPDENRYNRMIFGNVPVDLSGYYATEGDQGFIGRTDVIIKAVGVGDNFGAVSVGYFRLTIDEP